jgi:hypothetical protein
MRLKKLENDTHAFVDITVAITVGILFACLMVIAYIIWTVRNMLVPAAPLPGAGVTSAAYNTTYWSILHTSNNITGGFDQTIKIVIIAVLVAVLAIALSYLMMLRQG